MAEPLVMFDHSRDGAVVLVQGPELTIGRRSDSGLVISGPEVSRSHARLLETEEGFVLEDLGSANGTYLNGLRVGRSLIKSGDEIRIGNSRLTVHKLSEGHGLDVPAEEAFAEGDRLRGQGCLEEAVSAYERGLTVRPAAHDRRLVLGGLLEALGRWERAEKAYQAIPAGSSLHAEADKALSRISEKWHVYGKVKALLLEEGPATEALVGPGERLVVDGPGWTVGYPLSADMALLKTMAKTLALARATLLERLGVLPEKIPVEVYLSGAELRGESPAPTESFATWMAGVYDGTVRVAVGDGELPEPPFLVLLLTHEVAHVAVDHLSGGRAPAWLDEGIAQFVAQNLPRRAEKRLKEAAHSDALLPLIVLEAPFHLLEQKPMVDLAYAQASSLVTFLDRAVGWEGIRAVLARLAQGASSAEACQSVGWAYPRLEAAWQKSLLAGGR